MRFWKNKKTVASSKSLVVRAKANKLYKSLEMLFSVDGGPLTDNVVFASVQRLLARKAELASPKARLTKRSLTGHRR
ncbi:MAG TPA: hypothetical protein ENN47_07360 [Mesotoga infera]|uniref:Uncharacterized protein n=1 Tax=Mesotoga infera TaxID=1236046 RepID=A0A7C1H422_9BACT|nr:hypothetical protein [Mesotoga infera]